MKTYLLFLIFFVFVIPLKANIIHVPGDSLLTIQAGVNSAATGDTVLVQPGTYNENISIGKNIVVGSLFLTTGDTNYISSTIIAPTSNWWVIVFGGGRDSTCVLTGFTITGGNSGGFGAGIRCINTSPTISHNIIMNNTVSSATVCWGAGIFMEANSNPKIIFNQILNNTATYPTTQGFGGGIHSRDSSPFIANNIISNNSSDVEGGGIYFLNSQVRLFNNIISGNSSQNGGGIYCDGNSTGIISDNIIFADSASWYGGGIHITGNSNIEISNNVIHSNWSPWVAGLYIAGATSTIYNNTFCYNEAQNSALQYFASADTIYNNIFFGNIGSYVLSIGGIYLEHCDIYGNSGDIFNISPPVGTGVLTTVNLNGDSCDVYYNILMDPLFVDTTNFDFHLTENSPCIDAGDPNFPLDPDNTISDMGAFYFHQPGSHIQPGYVSGIWFAANSPYFINGDITIHADSALNIEPGVEVIFNGHYKFNVEGIISAVGAESDSIHFYAADTSVGWRGLRFTNSSIDTNYLAYCIFENGKATADSTLYDRRGGGVYCQNSNISVKHCTFRNNYAESMGGGLCSINGFLLTELTNNIFQDNICEFGRGGGAYIDSYDSLKLRHNLFIRNYCGQEGGGLHVRHHGTGTINYIQFCEFEENTSDFGGGIYWFHTNGTMVFYLEDCIFRNNNATYKGAGLWLQTDYTFINRCNFIGNRVIDMEGKGGGVYFTPNYGNGISWNNCMFAKNRAFEGGGIYFNDTRGFNIGNNTFFGNYSDEGSCIFVDSSHHPPSTINYIISNSIFAFNPVASNHGAIYVEGEFSAIEYSDFLGNGSNIYGNAPAGFGLIDSVNANGDSCDVYYNIFLNPLFADTANGDFHLTENSPCIDAGDPTSPLDPDGTITDMGAFSFDQSASIFEKEFFTGWNLVGLPLEVENPNYQILFPTSIPGTLFGYNIGYYST